MTFNIVQSHMTGFGELRGEPWTVNPSAWFVGRLPCELRTAFPKFGLGLADLADRKNATRGQLDGCRKGSEIVPVLVSASAVDSGIWAESRGIERAKAAADYIFESLPDAARLASSVFSASNGDAYQAVGGLGKVVARMCLGSGNKPTPTECHAWMLTGKDTTGATLM